MILGQTQPDPPGCQTPGRLSGNVTGAPAPPRPGAAAPSLQLVDLVSLVCLVYLVCLIFCLNETNQMDQINQVNRTNQISSSRGEVGIMPQDMVVRNLSDNDLSTTANGNSGQAPSPYNPKMLLLKMPYRFNKGYQLLVHSSASVLCDCSLSLDFQRSRP